MVEPLECPLCEYTVLPTEDYVLQLHFEQVHTEDSPFKIENDTEPLPPPLPARPSAKQPLSEDEDVPSGYVACPQPDCGEVVLLIEYNDHLDLHTAESLSSDEASETHRSGRSSDMHRSTNQSYNSDRFQDPSLLEQTFSTELPDALRRHDGKRRIKRRTHRSRADSNSSEKSTLHRSVLGFSALAKLNKAIRPPPNPTRLGRAELGPHAWEERMPKWLYEQLDAGPKITTVNRIGRDGRLIKQEQVQNETPGIIPILAQLSALDRTVKEAYYCHPSTMHIGKTPKEGSFCGYRNIQMLVSYIQGAHAQGQDEFPGRTPGILKLQDRIERAWDKGINEIGRAQTGGIRGTRKYIGTPEAQALFLSSEIDCAVEMFTDSPDGTEAHEHLLVSVETYFAQAALKNDGSNVCKTLLPPIYLQQPGHSLTIVGFERRKDGTCNLVIFDPTYHTCPAMHRLIGRKNLRTFRPEVMYNYRRGPRNLRKHAAFEILMLTAHAPLFPAWDVLRQFPDCRYLYAFFRSMTLGYDVYPEDYFLRHFPWWQYGGLYIVDEARFATVPEFSPVNTQALRRITSGGTPNIPEVAVPRNNISGANLGAPCHTLNQSRLDIPVQASALSDTQFSNFSLDGSNGIAPFQSSISSILDRLRMCTVDPVSEQSIDQVIKAHLASGVRYPGYPSPTSPTPAAKMWFPSPASGPDKNFTFSNLVSPTSPITVQFASNRFASVLPKVKNVPNSPVQSPTSSTGSALNPTLFNNHHSLSPSKWRVQTTMNNYAHSCCSPSTLSLNSPMELTSDSTPPSFSVSTPLSPSSIQIANGTETYIGSPLSPSGLMYKSKRPADSGLLALPALSETKVAEYRFWMPCGRRNCGIGCADKDVGEMAAARRLFKSEEQVRPDDDDDDDD